MLWWTRLKSWLFGDGDHGTLPDWGSLAPPEPVGTGLFATEEQRRRIMEAGDDCVPMWFSVVRPVGFPTVTHVCAVEQGLPDFLGDYGYNINTYEFLAPPGWKIEQWVDGFPPDPASDKVEPPNDLGRLVPAPRGSAMDTYVRGLIGIGKNVYGEDLVGRLGAGLGLPASGKPIKAVFTVGVGKPRRRITFEEEERE